MSDNGMVIIGAGEAGARAAAALREQGWNGPVTMIGDEPSPPYERPPLSKRHLTDDGEPAPATIMDAAGLAERNIRLLSGDAAVRIDRQAHEVELAGGRRIPYERLLLATGANPRRLTAAGTGAAELLYLRRFPDALALRAALRPGRRIAIIGGGFIGLEVAASAVQKGCQVTVIEVAPRILMRGVPEEIARTVEQCHRAAGVAFRIGQMIERIDREGGESVVRLADGAEIRCDTIVAGIGAAPETALAEGCGLAVENGIRLNGELATDDPDIFAAGDCCSFPHPFYGGRRIRLEAWRNAQDQGTHAAANMLGGSEPYTAIPWFWSDQYDQTLLVAGLPDGANPAVQRDLGAAGRLIFHMAEDGRVSSVSGIGPSGALAKEFRLAEMLIERQLRPDPLHLADPAIRLKGLLANS